MKRTNTCYKPEELIRLYIEGSDEAQAAHIQSCAQCSREWGRMKRLDELGDKIEVAPPSPERVDRMRIGLYS